MLFQNKRCWNKWLLESLFIISEDKIKCDHFSPLFSLLISVYSVHSVYEAFLMLSEFPPWFSPLRFHGGNQTDIMTVNNQWAALLCHVFGNCNVTRSISWEASRGFPLQQCVSSVMTYRYVLVFMYFFKVDWVVDLVFRLASGYFAFNCATLILKI